MSRADALHERHRNLRAVENAYWEAVDSRRNPDESGRNPAYLYHRPFDPSAMLGFHGFKNS